MKERTQPSCALNSRALNNHLSIAAHCTACVLNNHLSVAARAFYFHECSFPLNNLQCRCYLPNILASQRYTISAFLPISFSLFGKVLLIKVRLHATISDINNYAQYCNKPGYSSGFRILVFHDHFFHMIELKVSYLNCVSLAP